MSTETQTSQSTNQETYTGRCKWFNNRLGYGFITVDNSSEQNNVPSDLFVHQTNISPNSSTYRTLRQGEYVSFSLSRDDTSVQAVNVTGINGGPLLCDTQTPRPNNGNGQRGPRRPRAPRNRNRNRQEGEWVWQPYNNNGSSNQPSVSEQ